MFHIHEAHYYSFIVLLSFLDRYSPFGGSLGGCWSLTQLHMGEGMVHPGVSLQLIAGVPCVSKYP